MCTVTITAAVLLLLMARFCSAGQTGCISVFGFGNGCLNAIDFVNTAVKEDRSQVFEGGKLCDVVWVVRKSHYTEGLAMTNYIEAIDIVYSTTTGCEGYVTFTAAVCLFCRCLSEVPPTAGERFPVVQNQINVPCCVFVVVAGPMASPAWPGPSLDMC